MTTRILPHNEWERLAHTPLAPALHDLDPNKVHILVAEDGDLIVGCWAMSWQLHAECLWIDPVKRGKAGVLRRLLREMQRFAPSIFSVVDPETIPLAQKFGGVPLDGAHYLIPMREL